MTAAERLSTAIEELRGALCAGDLAALAPLADRIGSDLGELEAAPGPADNLVSLRARAAEVESLLAAAGQGLIAGRRRLDELRELKLGLGTYDQQGRKRRIAPETGAPPRRA